MVETKNSSEFVISRTFDAPRELVFAAFTEPERMKHWWGPKGFTVIHSKRDLRVGGIYHYCLRSPEGQEMWGKFVYREIVKPERLVFINSFSDKAGGMTRHPLSPNWPLEMLSTVIFAEREGKTTLTVKWAPHAAKEVERQTFDAAHEGMRMGWTGTLDQLTVYLEKREKEKAVVVSKNNPLVLTRIFNVPRERVFKAWTDSKLMARWWGPKDFTNPVCELDVRSIGKIRIDMTGPDGTVYPMGGIFHEIAAPERLVFTSTAFHDEKGKAKLEVHNTVTFAEQSGKTKLTLNARVVKAEPEVAGALAGMKEGWNQSLDRLAEVVKNEIVYRKKVPQGSRSVIPASRRRRKNP